MKKSLKLIGLIWAVFLPGLMVSAQRNCGYLELLSSINSAKLKGHQDRVSKLMRSFAMPESMPNQITIPIVVHIMHNPSDAYGQGSNITREQVLSQLEAMNSDFGRYNEDTIETFTYFLSDAGNPEIHFCLATIDPTGSPSTGITRFPYAKSSNHSLDRDDLSMKNLNRWNTRKYLNIWVVDNIAGGILAYAPSPDLISDSTYSLLQDGIVVSSNYFGSDRFVPSDSLGELQEGYRLGRTLTHELGHYFNLKHTWGDGDCSVDDGIQDTPNCSGTYFSCAAVGPIQCNEERMIQNYMDYSLDACMNLFTNGQVSRMIESISFFEFRTSITSDSNLLATGCNSTQTLLSLISKPEITLCLGDQAETISLRVHDSAGLAKEGVLVMMDVESSNIPSTERAFLRSDKDGELEFDLPSFTQAGFYKLTFYLSQRNPSTQTVRILVLENSESLDLVLFNNPSYSGTVNFRIESKNKTEVLLLLTSSVGDEIHRRELQVEGFLEDEIALGNVTSGVYYLSLISARTTATYKIIFALE